ncbi:unnamed protein product [Clonostachys chloroleuca]|uniref:Rhodopsin domain-containing protein n=1 Tax=Clonostachys chloroleuca TaxID=1926264 RepID=A0AA35M345_9HYPO|nr:unnamed protein product [Clonostachys chloroleuca]
MSSVEIEVPITCSPLPWKSNVLAFMVINGVISLFMAMSVVGRIYARITGAGLAIDDWFAIFAALLNIPLMTFQGTLSTCGSGYPLEDTMHNLSVILRIAFAYQITIIVTNFALKMSVLFFYTRVFKVRSVKIASYSAMVLVGVWMITFVFAVVFSCKPIKASWDLAAQAAGATCIQQTKMLVAMIFSNAVMDLMVMAIPIRSILHLQMRRTDKLGVLGCILLGAIATVASFFRGVYVSTVDFSDITGTMAASSFVSVLETLLAVLCICLPTIRPLWRRYRGDPSSSAGTMKLTGEMSGSRGPRDGQIRVTRDTHIDHRRRDLELHDMATGGRDHTLFDESSSEKNLTTTVTGKKSKWSSK